MAYTSKLTVSVRRVLAAVAEQYGISAEVIDIRHGYLSTTLTLQADAGTYVLKAYRIEEVDLQQLDFSVSASRQLRDSGIPIPDPVRARDGSESIHEAGNLMLLSRFLDGGAFEPGNEAQLRSAGAMLGRLHRAGACASEEEAGFWPPMWGTTVDGLRHRWRALTSKVLPDGQIELLRSHLDHLESSGIEGALGGLPRSVIHGDYRAQNLLFRENRVLAVLDLDSARPAERLYDLAYAVVFFQAVIAERPLSSAERKTFLQAYDREATLTDGERDLLPAFLRLSLLRGLTLWLQIAYVDGSNAAAAEWIRTYVALLDEKVDP